MSEKTREEALAHFGVKGMKWGVRNVRTNRTTAVKNARASNRASRETIRRTADKQERKTLRKAYKQSANRVAGRQLATGERAAVTVLGVYGSVEALSWVGRNILSPMSKLAVAGAEVAVAASKNPGDHYE